MSEGFAPLLFLLVIIWAFSGAFKGKRSSGGGSGSRNAGSGASGPSAGNQPRQTALQDSKMVARLQKEFPHLAGQLSAQAPAPAGEPSGARRPGSLTEPLPEGTDPCHDEPDAVPRGSLRAERVEGTDPCHDGWEEARVSVSGADREDPEETAASGGLNLSWTGEDIVRGFVVGEILKRKVG